MINIVYNVVRVGLISTLVSLVYTLISGMSPVKITIKDLEALVEVIKESEYVHPSQVAKRKVFQKYGILGTTKDRVLTAIYYQVMRKLGVIDKAITRVTNLPTVHILDPWLKAALRLATYMYVFCDKPIPKGLKEDLKRGIAKFLSNNTHPYVGVWYWDLIDKVLNNYKYIPQNEIEELELKYLIPSWLIEKLRNLLGPEETEQLLQAFNKRPFLSVRVNTLKATIDEVIKELKKEGKEPIIGRYVPTIVKFKGPYKFEKSKLFKEGKIIAQEESCALASIILNPKPGEIVVDMCAAPGGKTSHMAELMKNQGKIYAFDIDPVRIERMKETLRRLGIKNVEIYQEDVLKAPKILGEEFADKVLLDAPCSSSGVLAKYPEIRWRLRPEKIIEFAKQQYKMLKVAIRLAKPGGKILYTTCSIFPEEGEEVVKKILNEYGNYIKLIPLNGPYSPGFLEGTMRAWPHKHDTTGFFYALFEKIKSLK